MRAPDQRTCGQHLSCPCCAAVLISFSAAFVAHGVSSFTLSLLGSLEFPAPGVKTDHLPQVEVVGVRLWPWEPPERSHGESVLLTGQGLGLKETWTLCEGSPAVSRRGGDCRRSPGQAG